MSWFGETFGDSLNSLKGQITKITKEVLAEDEGENGDASSDKLNMKELEELCAAKDREINNLREENVKISEKFEEELNMLRNDNKKLKAECKGADEGNSFFSDGQIREICGLENQLQQIQLERDHLEELQKDHQSNICFVAEQRDNYKQELEKLKETHSALQVKYEELLNSKDDEKGGNYLSDINLTENQVKPDELINLKETTGGIQAQDQSIQTETDEMAKVLEEHEFKIEHFQEKIEKLMEDMRILGEEKKTIESENEKLKEMINTITTDLNNKIDELKAEQELRNEDGEKLKELTQTLESVEAKQADFQKYLDSQMKRLVNIFFDDTFNDEHPDISVLDLVTEIETFWHNVLAEKEVDEKIYAETLSRLENDILNLTCSKCDLGMRLATEMNNEPEVNSQEEAESSEEAKFSDFDDEECFNGSQSDDVKKLSQEVLRLKDDIDSKDEELKECYAELKEIGQELNCLRSISVKAEHDLFRLSCENDGYEHNMMEAKMILDARDRKICELMRKENSYQERIQHLENENMSLFKENGSLTGRMSEARCTANFLECENMILKKKMVDLILESDSKDTAEVKDELLKLISDIENSVAKNDKEWGELKAQDVMKESKITEQEIQIRDMKRELTQTKQRLFKLRTVQEELKKCKDLLIDNEIQKQEMAEESELIRTEYSALKVRVMNMQANDAEIERLTRENIELKEICNRLELDIENRMQESAALAMRNDTVNDDNSEMISSLQSENSSLKSYIQEQKDIITNLTAENNELKRQLQPDDENACKVIAEVVQPKQDGCEINDQDTNSIPDTEEKKNGPQPLGGSNPDVRAGQDADIIALRTELEKLQEMSQRQIDEYKTLQEQFNIIADKEAHSKKELERLRVHLIDTENYYVDVIDEYKAKLNVVEEQLKNSSSFYTSNKVRNNQHLESLQSQVRLLSAQRDSLQRQLAGAEEEILSQKSTLISLHVVLEQFQQDKERECQNIADKYQCRLLMSDNRLAELQKEKESLNTQLLDAKNGLKAASRLGEQLEKKNEYVADLEGKVARMEADVKELEEALKLMNQSDAEKVDKSLLKNLLLGYISSQKPDRKEQVLRIMMSVLDFDEEERNKMGIDNAQPGWLSSLLHPKNDGESSSQSLSEAFIRFLENESRPQPQLKLLPEDTSNSDNSKSGSGDPKTPRLLEELVLPTFNSPQSSESTILKDVLNNP